MHIEGMGKQLEARRHSQVRSSPGLKACCVRVCMCMSAIGMHRLFSLLTCHTCASYIHSSLHTPEHMLNIYAAHTNAIPYVCGASPHPVWHQSYFGQVEPLNETTCAHKVRPFA